MIEQTLVLLKPDAVKRGLMGRVISRFEDAGLEGVNAVEVVRKLVGGTEPKSALPGTIRGDFAHMSYADADGQNKAIENLIHASGNAEEAKQEIALWFKSEELHSYKTAHEAHVF